MSEDRPVERDPLYTEFDAFLKAAIYRYYELSGKRHKGSFIALLVASGEMTSLALDSLTSGTGAKKIALGAVGLIALRLGLRYALSGPLGILLVGASAASLLAYFIGHRHEMGQEIDRKRILVGDLRKSYHGIQSDFRDGRLDVAQRNLMLDGLMQRFLSDLDS